MLGVGDRKNKRIKHDKDVEHDEDVKHNKDAEHDEDVEHNEDAFNVDAAIRNKLVSVEGRMQKVVGVISDNLMGMWNMFRQKKKHDTEAFCKNRQFAIPCLDTKCSSFRRIYRMQPSVQPLPSHISGSPKHTPPVAKNKNNSAQVPNMPKVKAAVDWYYEIYDKISVDVAMQWYTQIQCHSDRAGPLFETSVSIL